MNPSMSETMIHRSNLEQLAELLRRAGYRATVASDAGRPLVQSAAQGLGFLLMPGNAAADEPGSYVDFSFNCLIRLEQKLAPGLIESWNEGKRFGRCFQRDGLLALSHDVMLVGGVSERYLLSQCELWDRLMHDFIAHLRQPTQAAAPTAAATG